MLKFFSLPAFVLVLSQITLFAENLLRNGSFEGCLLYWHGTEPAKHTLVKDAKNGTYALHSTEGNIMSAPWLAEPGKDYTVSFWVKGDQETEVRVQMPPSAREVGTNSKRLWVAEATQSAKVTKEWQRVAFTWKADVPQDGFWPLPHYMVQIEGKGLFVDGVVVQEGKVGAQDYVPRADVEVLAECPDLPGYKVNGNLLEKGKPVNVVAHAHNPSAKPISITLDWNLLDYESQGTKKPVRENRRIVGSPDPTPLILQPGETVSQVREIKTLSNGCSSVQAEVRRTASDKTLDSSAIPLTVLPYPKAATKPDPRERFGGSFAGEIGMVKKLQSMGMRWIRWRPHSNGADHLPEKPTDLTKPETWKWKWFDKELDEQEAHGFSSHLVLYPPPTWIMEKEYGGHPLPTDMRWKADDPRWEDLSVKTVWDHFVEQTVKHYQNRSVIFEIENEPEFDQWMDRKLGDEYAKFTMRTARLIKQTAPKAKVMVNNVYGIPSPVNAVLFSQKNGLKDVDVISWHDYHAGWLADATQIKRYRQNLDEAGGQHVEIWFNEGWAFTNTAVDEPPACTGLTSAESTNAIMASVTEMTVAGQAKTILFHTGYETHGMSFWDYSGPGTCLWDWYDNPLPLVAAWNVLAHHISLSEPVGLIRPPGCNLAVFQDLRNQRGVVVAYADRGAKQDVTVTLPMTVDGEDLMGNKLSPTTPKGVIILSKTGRLVYLYDGKTTGKEFHAALEKLDRKHTSFVSNGESIGPASYKLPPVWEGTAKNSSEGSTVLADGKPVWKLEQLWPADWKKPENFQPMIWTGTDWNVKEGGFGGQPGASLKDTTLTLGTRAPHGPAENDRHERTAALVFVAPQTGNYQLQGTLATHMWDSKNSTKLQVLKKSRTEVTRLQTLTIAAENSTPLSAVTVALTAGEELVLLPEIDGMFAGGDASFKDFSITQSGAAATWSLPAVWEGAEKGSAKGNPLTVANQPIWRLDQLINDDFKLTTSYRPMIWNGTEWSALEGGQGGHPSIKIADGNFSGGVLGPWTGPGLEHQKTAALAFIAPQNGTYRLTAQVHFKPWEGGSKSFKVLVLKKDTQRAGEIAQIEVSRDNTPGDLTATVELNAGHELLLLPIMPDYHNATQVSLDHVSLSLTKP